MGIKTLFCSIKEEIRKKEGKIEEEKIQQGYRRLKRAIGSKMVNGQLYHFRKFLKIELGKHLKFHGTLYITE